MGRKMLVALIVLGVLTIGMVNPPRAEANIEDGLKQGLIIAGATGGALILITLIAIFATRDDDEPDFLAEAPRRKDESRLRVGFQATRTCPIVGGNISLACW
jgi:hypothetical protein